MPGLQIQLGDYHSQALGQVDELVARRSLAMVTHWCTRSSGNDFREPRLGDDLVLITQYVGKSSQPKLSPPVMAPTQSEEPVEAGPRLKESEERWNFLPPKVRLTRGLWLQGTTITSKGRISVWKRYADGPLTYK